MCLISACTHLWEDSSCAIWQNKQRVVPCGIAHGHHAIHPPSARMRTRVATAADVRVTQPGSTHTLSGNTTIQALAAPPPHASLSVWRTASGPHCSRISAMEFWAVVTAGCLPERLHTVLPTNRWVSNERGASLRCHGPRTHTHSRTPVHLLRARLGTVSVRLFVLYFACCWWWWWRQDLSGWFSGGSQWRGRYMLLRI